MYRVEINFPKCAVWKDFATAGDALDFYEQAKGLTNHCVKVLLFDISSKQIEPATLAECLMQWSRADKLREQG